MARSDLTHRWQNLSYLYCLIAVLATYAVHQFLGHGYNYIQALKTVADPSSDYDASPLAHILLPLVLCAGIVISLKFMWDARHPKTG